MSIAVDQLLEEGAPLPPEPPLDFWQPDAAQFRADGPRIERAFQKYFALPGESQEKDSHEIIVCHANVIRYCVCRALQVGSFWLYWLIRLSVATMRKWQTVNNNRYWRIFVNRWLSWDWHSIIDIQSLTFNHFFFNSLVVFEIDQTSTHCFPL